MQTKPLALLVCLTYAAGAQPSKPDAALFQRLHQNAALYSKWDQGESLRAKAAKTSRDVSDEVDESENAVICPDCAAADTQNDPWIKRSTSQSDIVVVGTVKGTMSALTPREAFVYSDAQVSVSSVWFQSKSNASAEGDASGNEITVTFPGGQVKVDGHKVSSTASAEMSLRSGRSYILFLKFVPESQSYELIGVKGFDITDATVHPLHRDAGLESRPIMRDKAAATAAVRNSVDRAKSEAGK